MKSRVVLPSGSSFATLAESCAIPSSVTCTTKVSGLAASPLLASVAVMSSVSRSVGSLRESVSVSTLRSASGVSEVARALARFWMPPDTEMTSVCAPNLLPSVHSVDPSPFSSLVVDSTLTEPLSAPGANEISCPATPCPPRSSRRTTTGSGRVVPRSASCPSPETTLTAAARCCTCTVAVPVSPLAAASSVPDPFPAAVTCPLPSTVKTASSELDQVTAVAIAEPYWSRTVAVKVVVWEM